MRALTFSALVLGLAAGSSQAQVVAPPPALPAPSEAAQPAPAKAARTRIDLPQAQPPAEAPSPAPAADEGLVPTEAEMQAARRAHVPAPDHETRIVEVVKGKRVTEVIVTPGLTQRSYVMENRAEGAASTPGSASGTLTVPRFLRLDF